MGNGEWGSARQVRQRHATLLFQCAYPTSLPQWESANRKLHELAVHAWRRADAGLQNSGIAGTTVVASFSPAITQWLVDRYPGAVALDAIDGDPDTIMRLLAAALHPVEAEVLDEHPIDWGAWQRRHLGAGRTRRLRRLLALVSRLPGGDGHREAVFGTLKLFAKWHVPPDAPVLTAGRFGRNPVQVHRRRLRRRASLATTWGQGPGRRVRLTSEDRRELVDLARGTLASLLGETDPFTYPATDELECHDLGEGIQVALYPCSPARKLALEAYVGYLLLKNRVPIAYGGGWVLGRQARFGINVLPPFRGGESALLLAQLLRLYAHRFGLKLFLVEPYQIGRRNPDGIRSGAFWFYWRLGFRPRQRELLQLAHAERRRMAAGGGRSPAATLRRLAHAVMAWEAPMKANWHPIDIEAVGAHLSRDVLERFDGDRTAATRAAQRKLGMRDPRLAALLAAIAPPAGWPRRDLARLDQVMAAKDRNELDQAVRLGRLAWLMQALAGASTPDGMAR